ncbi:hypothetical protein RLOatenuis_7810 [Rickettsiales bacterium]|nr:hypothetical protein RLOatenuis_7810 [Rickettsiales bacterium]
MDSDLRSILNVDFFQNWESYIGLVKAYVMKGNASQDYKNSFFLEDNHIRNRNHIPWKHWRASGREGFHGLTREGGFMAPYVLAPQQTSKTIAYAVGFYNNIGSYVIGKVWETGQPDTTFFNNNTFPEGSVSAKLLFVDLDEKQVPYLVNPIECKAYIYECDSMESTQSCDSDPKVLQQSKRIVRNLRLLQMDILVRDNRAKATGWAAGTFVYNGKLNKENRRDNLVPVGLMWGNDPDKRKSFVNDKVTETIINPDLKETVINKSSDLPAAHLGWSGRLNGPADNPASSCISCHQTAQYPPVSAIMPFLNKAPL